MARSGSSSKFVPVNLNSSYGQALNGASSASSGLGRSRSFGSYGGMVPLSRSSRVAPSPSSSAASRTSKLAVPRPVNLPSLRREHSGNDPTIALVGSHGSSGWSKQNGDGSVEVSSSRSDADRRGSSSWTSRASAPEEAGVERRLLSGSRQSPFSPPAVGEAPVHGAPTAPATVVKAVVFRGADFPTLQAAAAPSSASVPPALRSRDLQQKHGDRPMGSLEEGTASLKKEAYRGDDSQESNGPFDRNLQPAPPLRMQTRSAFLDQADDFDRVKAHRHGSSPLIKLAHTSNWADDERETLSNVRMQDSSQQEKWVERNDGLHMLGDRTMSHNDNDDYRHPIPRAGHQGGNTLDFSMPMVHISKTADTKDLDFRRDSMQRGLVENNRFDTQRLSSNSSFGRNNVLKRGWSFPATDSQLNKGMRHTYPNNRLDQDSYLNGITNSVRHASRDISSPDEMPGSQNQNRVQWHYSKFGKDVMLGRQGFPGGAAVSVPKSVRGSSLSYGGSKPKTISGIDFKRERRVSGFYGQVHTEDSFMGDVVGSRPPAIYGSHPKMKKDSLNAEDYRDLARESFEAELERVEEMLEQERRRAIEERERAIELLRKEQEEQERIAREEEEQRLKIEEEAREAAFRAQKEAEEAAIRFEEARRAREEEKRIAESEEDRRKEAARRKLLELEERIAKREVEKRKQDALEKERGANIRTFTKDFSIEDHETWPRKNEASRDFHCESLSSNGKADRNTKQVLSKAPVSGPSPFPSIVRSRRGSHFEKEENGSACGGVKHAQTWKKGSPSNESEPRSVQKGPPNFLHLQSDHHELDNEEHQQAPFLSSVKAQKSTSKLSESRISGDADERDWWGRDVNMSSALYSQDSDLSEFPLYGRIRQSLPKQPRVLPPPPGRAIFCKQPFQRDENHSEGSTGSIKSGEGSPLLNKGNGFLTGDNSTGASNRDALVHVPEQFDAALSEEVVLSDAGSQFSDDSIEDVAIQADQEPELHSDVVSEAFSEGEADEISNLTEAQESSEDSESPKQAGFQNQDCSVVQCDKQERMNMDELERNGLLTRTETIKQGEDVCFAQNDDDSCLIEDAAATHLDGFIEDAPVPENEGKQAAMSELQAGKKLIQKEEELTAEKTPIHDHELHVPDQASSLPVVSDDLSQIRHIEGLGSRQSLLQQFQQPFSFMAVPLPQSSTLSNVGVSLPALSNVHTLSNHQDLSYHVQVGLMPSLPLWPNAIQIGSIQMPLHIHPQIPQLSHLHSHQHAPVFQFGQIGPLAISPPVSVTQVSPASMQVLNASRQSSSMQHTLLQHDVSAKGSSETADLSGFQNLENVCAPESTSLLPLCQDSATNKHAEIAQGALCVATIDTINAEKGIKAGVSKSEMEAVVCETLLQPDAHRGEKGFSKNKMEAMGVDSSSPTEFCARLASRPSGDRLRKSNSPRYHGILGCGRGRGQGRFRGRGGHHSTYHQVSHLAAESQPEGAMKRFSRGKMIRRNYSRVEYRIREPLQLSDQDTSVPDIFSSPSSNIEDTKEGVGYRYVRRGSGGLSSNSADVNGQLAVTVSHPSERITANLPCDSSIIATATKSKSLSRKYKVNNAEDAPFQTGIVRVFEQPGIETPNDKDDFIKVRSKRQLLREVRQQREKENTLKSQDGESIDLASKKQPKVATKIGGAGAGMVAATASKKNKNILKKGHSQSDGKPVMASFSNEASAMSIATLAKRVSALSKVAYASKAMVLKSEGSTAYGNDIHASEHSATAAWGGQQSNQEVVSLTQIQLEEAMKPFRLDVHFSESAHSLDEGVATVESVLPCSSSSSVEKAVISVKASDPLSSLLAGEKIQLGAVTSPTPIPPENCSLTQASSVRTGSSIDFGSDPPYVPGHMGSFVTSFLDSCMDATYALEKVSERKDDNHEGKIVDLEAEAAASAVVAAAISSEDTIDSHSHTQGSEMNAGCTSIASGSSVVNATSGLDRNHCVSDNPIAVALPADLSVETPPLFQGSSITLANSPGVVLQSLRGGAPTFPCLEMGPRIGGPIFSLGPREDLSRPSMEPGLSGWQQRQVGAPDSYYGPTPFFGPAGLSSIQGHPHMLVYMNPYTQVGPFGQLGVSFMGTAYHPSGKQPDWTYVPVPTASLGASAMNDENLNVISNGMMPPQPHADASNLLQTQGGSATASSVMSNATPQGLSDPGFAAPFQISQMDGLMQPHWSKAPAPPLQSVSVAGSPPPLSLSRPDVDLNVHPNVLTNQGGHSTNLMDGSASFYQRSIIKASTSSCFSHDVDASARFPDELGLGDTLSTVSSLETDACGRLSDSNSLNGPHLIEASGFRMQRTHLPSQSSQGHLKVVNEANRRELISSSSREEQNSSGFTTGDSEIQNVGRRGFMVFR